MFWRKVAAVLAIWLFLSLPVLADDYQFQTNHDRDGIGKIYMGREIAEVMGHQGAGWLERSSRTSEEQPEKAIAALQLKPDSVVADIGAGTGYFSFRIAPQVSKVYAVDVQPEMIEILNYLKDEKKIANVEPILGSETEPNLPENSVDLALLVDAYHEFEYPKEMMAGIRRSLKSHGRVVLLEYRGENPFVFIKPLHKMTQKQVRQEMTAAGLNYVETRNGLPQQHILIFEKAG
ncbi:class I SAM-dependent methyltransferase [Leptolyngbya sp. AN03gr2]|uniref:class I SAM-dependent methyltransferase n=1 Tax=unclassified Leptolyngbya TaxID=2650499 RepID=UPI003D31696B